MKKKILTLLSIIAIFAAVIISGFPQEANADTKGICDYNAKKICCVRGGDECGGLCDEDPPNNTPVLAGVE